MFMVDGELNDVWRCKIVLVKNQVAIQAIQDQPSASGKIIGCLKATIPVSPLRVSTSGNVKTPFRTTSPLRSHSV